MLIGLTGYKRSGKNTVAGIMRQFMPELQELAFANPLRDMARAIDPVVGFRSIEVYDYATGGVMYRTADEVVPVHYSEALDELGYEEAKDSYPLFREFLQNLGTEGVREVLCDKYGLSERLDGDLLWVSLARAQARKTPDAIFTDVRFPDEADMIREEGGLVFRVWRGEDASKDAHPSERAMDSYNTDRIIDNTGTKSELWNQVAEAIDMAQGLS